MRSFLTMLGIIIGIAAIIAIVSTIKGTSEQIKENLVGSGDNIVNVKLMSGEWEYVTGENSQPDNVPMITDEIKDEILNIDEVSAVAAYRYGSMYQGVVYGANKLNGATIVGVDKDYFTVMGYMLTEGRLFSENDRSTYKKFAVVDDATAGTLFNSVDPVGETLEIMGDTYVIIGVVEQNSDFKPTVENVSEWYTYYGSETGGKIFVTDCVWPMIYYFDEPYHVVVKAVDTEAMTQAGKKTEDLLNSYITADDTGETDSSQNYQYKSDDLLETAKSLQEISQSTSRQLIWIASISLLVGGIGVMNIMLVSVTERTREIGLKKALGARKKVILGQFLTEAAVLTSLGGILGVGAGIGLAYLISGIAEVPVAISGAAIALSVIFSMFIGIVFGLIPSVKAANLNPIDALRYE